MMELVTLFLLLTMSNKLKSKTENGDENKNHITMSYSEIQKTSIFVIFPTMGVILLKYSQELTVKRNCR